MGTPKKRPPEPSPSHLRKCSSLQVLSGSSSSSSSSPGLPAALAAQAQQRGMLLGRAVQGTLCRHHGSRPAHTGGPGRGGGKIGGEFRVGTATALRTWRGWKLGQKVGLEIWAGSRARMVGEPPHSPLGTPRMGTAPPRSPLTSLSQLHPLRWAPSAPGATPVLGASRALGGFGSPFGRSGPIGTAAVPVFGAVGAFGRAFGLCSPPGTVPPAPFAPWHRLLRVPRQPRLLQLGVDAGRARKTAPAAPRGALPLQPRRIKGSQPPADPPQRAGGARGVVPVHPGVCAHQCRR